MGKVCDKYCKDCIYYHGWYESNAHCNFLLWTDLMRRCDPGKGCKRKVSRKNGRKIKVIRNG